MRSRARSGAPRPRPRPGRTRPLHRRRAPHVPARTRPTAGRRRRCSWPRPAGCAAVRGEGWRVVRGPVGSEAFEVAVVAPLGQVPHDVPAELVRFPPHLGDQAPAVHRGVVPLAHQRGVVDIRGSTIGPVQHEVSHGAVRWHDITAGQERVDGAGSASSMPKRPAQRPDIRPASPAPSPDRASVEGVGRQRQRSPDPEPSGEEILAAAGFRTRNLT
jgi:hypothetical protein